MSSGLDVMTSMPLFFGNVKHENMQIKQKIEFNNNGVFKVPLPRKPLVNSGISKVNIQPTLNTLTTGSIFIN